MRVVFTARARTDLARIGTFIAADNPSRALTFLRELQHVCTAVLAAHPLLGVSRPDISEGLRVHIHAGYLICYRTGGETLTVLRIFHGSYDISRRF